MSTEFGTIKSARFNNVVTVYTSLTQQVTLLIESGSLGQGVKIILDEDNIDDFLGALSTAIKHKDIFSNYLNPNGKRGLSEQTSDDSSDTTGT